MNICIAWLDRATNPAIPHARLQKSGKERKSQLGFIKHNTSPLQKQRKKNANSVVATRK